MRTPGASAQALKEVAAARRRIAMDMVFRMDGLMPVMSRPGKHAEV
jgi:hypothetical protein